MPEREAGRLTDRYTRTERQTDTDRESESEVESDRDTKRERGGQRGETDRHMRGGGGAQRVDGGGEYSRTDRQR